MAIFTLMFKTPDVLDQIAEDQVINDIADHALQQALVDSPIKALTDEENDAFISSIHEMKEFAKGFVRFSEYLTVEFDTVAGTAKVLPCKKY